MDDTRPPSALRLAAPARVLAVLLAGAALAGEACHAGPDTPYDYVVVGSGAGGGPLACRLARAGRRVLLLEAGDDVGAKLEYQVPAMHAVSTETEGMAWWYWVRHSSDPAVDAQDSKITEQGILYPRGSALGGSTAVNAMVTVLPSPADWDRLAELTGAARYRAANMTPLYERVREWLPITLPDPTLAATDTKVVNQLLSAVEVVDGVDLGDEAPGADDASLLTRLLAGDVNAALAAGEATGVFRLPLAVKDGARRGTREAIVETVAAGYPLTVRTGAFVTGVRWEDPTAAEPRAVGVDYVRGRNVYAAGLGERGTPGATETAYAAREVILSAGVFNSPQLLMLSGVGPAADLRALGIEPVVDLPGVGHNLQDRYEAAVVAELDEPITSILDCELGQGAATDPCLDDWFEGDGVYTTNGFAATALVRSRAELEQADLQVFAFPADARGYYPGYSADALATRDHFSWLILEAHTHNDDGVVSLVSADPFARPSILFNSYDEVDPLADPDLDAMVAGVKLVRAITERARERDPAATITEIWPGADVADDTAIAEFVRRESWGHHACCTDAMGAADDPDAVVDPEFRVRGTRGLRVVDASVFPEIPGTFIALPTFMLSEAAADVILAGEE